MEEFDFLKSKSTSELEKRQDIIHKQMKILCNKISNHQLLNKAEHQALIRLQKQDDALINEKQRRL